MKREAKNEGVDGLTEEELKDLTDAELEGLAGGHDPRAGLWRSAYRQSSELSSKFINNEDDNSKMGIIY